MENKSPRIERLYMVQADTNHSKKTRLHILRLSVAHKKYNNKHRGSLTLRPQTRKIASKHNNFKRGPGYWKYNTSLLTETDFESDANPFIDANFYEYQNDNPDIAREMFKLKVKSFCLDLANNRSKNRRIKN